MPTSLNSDETPAWIKGDLPAAVPGVSIETLEARPAADSVSERPAGRVTPDQPVEPPMPEFMLEAPDAAPLPANVTSLDDAGPAAQGEPGLPAEPAALEPPAVEALSVEALIESLLFVADGAVPVGRLAEALEAPTREVEAALAALSQGYRRRGLSLQRFRDRVQLTTSPSAAAQVERFLGLAAASPLSRAALETLAIVAYQQPVTRPQLEAVRGVNSDSVIKNLLSKGLIEESGRAEGPGRPVLYSTTPEFMQHFGLASLADLPPLALPGLETAASPDRMLKS